MTPDWDQWVWGLRAGTVWKVSAEEQGVTEETLYAEVPKYKVITVSVISDRLKVTGSLAREALRVLHKEGLIKRVNGHPSTLVYTRAIKAEGGAEE